MPLYRSFSRRRLRFSPDPLSSFDEDARLREDGPALEEEGCDEGGGGGGGRLTRAWCESIKSYPDAFAKTQNQRDSSALREKGRGESETYKHACNNLLERLSVPLLVRRDRPNTFLPRTAVVFLLELASALEASCDSRCGRAFDGR